MSTYRETLARLDMDVRGAMNGDPKRALLISAREVSALVKRVEEMRKALEWAKYYVPVIRAGNPVYQALLALDKEVE